MKFALCIGLMTALIFIGCGAAQAPKTNANTNLGPMLIDVRSPGEFYAGHLAHALNFPYTEITDTIRKVITDPNKSILLYCMNGNRALRAKKSLDSLGYQSVQVGTLDSLSKIYPYGD